MKRKVLSVMLCAAMVVSMTACGGSDAKENTASANASVSETEQGEATEQDAQEEEPITCTLTVWSPSEDQDPEYGQWLNTMCDQFNELHPNWDITFNYGVCTESDAKKLVPQDIDAAADVFIYSSTGLENLCQANSLTEFGGKYLDTIRENYSSVLADSLTYDDGVYGVPMTTNTYFMYYDKSVFSEDDIKSLDTMLEKGKVAIPLNNGFYLASFYLGAGATFFGEEDTEGNAGAQADGEFTFYIDPIDGTTNFMFDYHHSCISVGLAHKDQMIAGFVYHPYINDMYIAIRGKGSYLNGKRIQLADKSVTEGIVEFGCARYNEAGIDCLFRVVKDMFQNSLSIRCGGSAALGLCRAASGSNTVYLELKLQPYDYAAASVILEEAGGVITQIDGSPITLHEGCSIIGGTPKAWKESKEAFERLRDSSAEGTTKVKLNK